MTRIAAIIFTERTANHRQASTAISMEPVTSQTLSDREANSSSDSGTDPVSRTVTPLAGVRPIAFASARIVSAAAPPGLSVP